MKKSKTPRLTKSMNAPEALRALGVDESSIPALCEMFETRAVSELNHADTFRSLTGETAYRAFRRWAYNER